MGPATVGLALVYLCLVLGASSLIRRYAAFLHRLHIPTAVIAGAVGLCVGPEGLGQITGGFGLLSAGIFEVWQTLPGLLINVVFGALLIGKMLPRLAEIWDVSAPHVIGGSVVSLGQFALAGLATALLLGPVFGFPPAAGVLLEMSFAGGHGTVAGLQGQLEAYGVAELRDIGLGLATVSMVVAVTIGSALANRIRRDAPGADSIAGESDTRDLDIGRLSQDRDDPAGPGHAAGLSALASALMFVGLAIAVGIVLLRTLRWSEALILGTTLFQSLPLFPLAVVGSAIVQLLARPMRYERALDRRMTSDVGGAALDLLIASAIATMSLTTIRAAFVPILILTTIGTIWSVAVFHYLAPRLFARDALIHGIADFGQGVGNVATGFVLVDIADPDERSQARTAYAYKQLLYEPFFGGGIVTALAVPLIGDFGLATFSIGCGIGAVLLASWGMHRARAIRRRLREDVA